MAERRMFAKSIVLSDAFLDMPLSARCLYFTFGMLADDDGFINNPKSIMRQCGASQDDLAVLITKKYLLAFESGVIVVRDWRINNYLRSDRYSETKCIDERSKLSLSEDGSYVKKTDGIIPSGIPTGTPTGIPSGVPQVYQSVYQPDTQVRVVKDSIGYYNYQLIADMYNEVCTSFPKITVMSEKRKSAIRARLKKYTEDQFRKVFEKAEASDFLKGANKRNWIANFDWIIADTNFAKILDGNYDNRSDNRNFKSYTENQGSFDADDFFQAALQRSMSDLSEGGDIQQ